MKTLIIIATVKWDLPKRISDYPEVLLFGQDDDNPAVEFIGRYEMESGFEEIESYPELHNCNYHKLMDFALLKYMEYFDTDDWNITYINQYIDLK